MLSILKSLLGLGAGSAANTITGAVNHLVFLPALIYLIEHADKRVNLGETSLGFLALIVGFAYVLLEMNRRTQSRSDVRDFS